MRLLIATNENKDFDSKLSEHFGHCPYFAIYDSNTKKITMEKNELDPSDVNKSPVDQILEFKPDKVFSLGMGQRAITLFNEKEVKIVTGNYKTVRDVIENLDNLKELNSSCGH